jgi:hypothetical protein
VSIAVQATRHEPSLHQDTVEFVIGAAPSRRRSSLQTGPAVLRAADWMVSCDMHAAGARVMQMT